jgi:response regulator RpfG family c-di-GMP phosphodiesterase
VKAVLIDDSTVNVTLLRVLARQIAGCETVEFTDPHVALQWCQNNDHDLVVLDYMMPGLDGLALIKALRSSTRCLDVPILMLTASHDDEVRYEALNRGANDFLTKPVDRLEFLARVRNLLALRRAQRELAERADRLQAEVDRATKEVIDRENDTIFRLSRAAEYRDPETGAHVLRMAHYSRLIAQRLGLPDVFQDLLFHAAPMHDIGKVGTPDNILLKPGKLTPEEMVVMRQHAEMGHEILRDSPSPVLQMAAIIALSHHERYDGTGYPNALLGQDIPLAGRIVAVADVFDALTSERPYKKAWPIEEAVSYMRDQSGKHFDPGCVEAFFRDMSDILRIRQTFTDEPRDSIAHLNYTAAIAASKELV